MGEQWSNFSSHKASILVSLLQVHKVYYIYYYFPLKRFSYLSVLHFCWCVCWWSEGFPRYMQWQTLENVWGQGKTCLRINQNYCGAVSKYCVDDIYAFLIYLNPQSCYLNAVFLSMSVQKNKHYKIWIVRYASS